ncbi:outer membrane beta-barrel protein [Alkanindiges hydrocarboniclasticus]|nr:outer membrane beta-barrel protein [Alkanindiges hydrocarboniclasticus]
MKKQLCGMAILLAGVPVAHAEPYFMLGYGQAENAGDRINKQFKGDFTKATSITAGAGYEYDSRISAELEYSYTQEFDNKANTTGSVKSQALAAYAVYRSTFNDFMYGKLRVGLGYQQLKMNNRNEDGQDLAAGAGIGFKILDNLNLEIGYDRLQEIRHYGANLVFHF